MLLDAFKVDSLTIQVTHETNFWLWDRSGAIATELCKIWPDLKLVEGQPQQQTLKKQGVQIQTGIKQSTITLSGLKSVDTKVMTQAKETFELWRAQMQLEQLTRVSARAIYAKEYPSLKEANAAMLALHLVRLPSDKVFDQPKDSDRNSVEVLYRFEDEKSFSMLRVRAEEIKFAVDLDPPFEDQELKKVVRRLVIDFDRGVLGTVNAATFRMDEWLKGFQHVLRRDVEKIVGSHV